MKKLQIKNLYSRFLTFFYQAKLALKQHYTTPLELVFNQFRLGAGIFFVGFILIYTSKQLHSSVVQELTLLMGVVIVLSGFCIAITAHIRMTIIRIIRVISKENTNHTK
jgi:hypothetical protein